MVWQLNIPPRPFLAHQTGPIWREMLEREMEKGKTVAEAAEGTMQEFVEMLELEGGITNVAYFNALSWLDSPDNWSHGSELRRWHTSRWGV